MRYFVFGFSGAGSGFTFCALAEVFPSVFVWVRVLVMPLIYHDPAFMQQRHHDLELFRQSGAIQQIPEDVTAGGDAGYQGLHDELPNHSVFVPHKATRNHPLSEDQKLVNRELSSIRIVVENSLAELKHFKVLADRYRHSLDSYDDTFRSVVALVNPRIARRVAAVA